jgi:hypothetical protein
LADEAMRAEVADEAHGTSDDEKDSDYNELIILDSDYDITDGDDDLLDDEVIHDQDVKGKKQSTDTSQTYL